MSPAFIHLRVRSTYSLLEGAVRIKELVDLAKKQHMPAVALTDSNNMFAGLEFSLAAASAGVQPIMGCLLSFAAQDSADARPAGNAGLAQESEQLLLLAKDEAGYRNLIALSSLAYLDSTHPGTPLLAYATLQGRTDGLIALCGGRYGGLGKRLLAGRDEAASSFLAQCLEWFPGRFYIELMRHGLEEEARLEPLALALAAAHHVPLVATGDVYFGEPSMYEAHDALLCIAEGRYVSESERRRLTPEHYFASSETMRARFNDIPEALENSVAIARRCAVMATTHAPILPRYAEDEAETLRREARAGLEERLTRYVFTDAMDDAAREAAAAPYRARLEFEIATIIAMQFPGYFLIVSDFIRWSKEHDIPVGPGRGSGAGSVVAWALLITDLDPLKYGLLFERFLNPERVSMPDFDVDFCQDRRDEVIEYVQQKYGAERVAQIITFGKLQARAVLRDVGRVLQLPYSQVDSLCKFVPNNPAHPVTLEQAINLEPALRQAIRDDETVAHMVDIALKLEGLNRHASTHAAGVVIADRALETLVPVTLDAKSNMRVIQYSMKYAELAGLVKFDFLGLKTLTVLKKAVDFVAKKGIHIDLLQLPEGDAATYAMLSRGDTTGVFQLESAGMRDTLKRLKPDCLEDIIALVSLYRPGPMDNIPTYINRKHGLEKPEYLHPKLAEALRETFGVIIYQEQVMQIAQLLAGYSLGEADLLRRAMGKKIRAEMEAQRHIFTERAIENGVPKAQAVAIFDLIAKFAEYGFNKSHAAAYALIAYQTAYMKARFPAEFFAASMTYDMHNTDKLAILREEASRAGLQLLPPDINQSGVEFIPESDQVIRYGLSAVRNVGAQAMVQVVEARARGGAFTSIWDLASRLGNAVMNKRQMEYLAKAGAFDGLGCPRGSLLAGLDLVLGYNAALERERSMQQASLFGGANDSAIPLPALPEAGAQSAMERMAHENEALGFYLSSHPIEGYRPALTRLHVVKAADLPRRLGPKYAPAKVAGLVGKIKVKSSEKGRYAFVSLSDESGAFEISIYDESLLATSRDQFATGAIVVAHVDGKQDESGLRLILQSVSPIEAATAAVQHQAVAAHILITLAGAAPLAALAQLLGAPREQGTRVSLDLPLGDRCHARLALPARYALTPHALTELAALAGAKWQKLL